MANPTYINADGVVLSLTSTGTSQLQTIWSTYGATSTVYGNSGDNDFVLFDPADTVVIPAKHGVYTVTDSAWNAAYTLPTGINNLIANGDLQIVSGNAQANLVETGSNRVTASGGGGDDVFVLGTGADTIVDPQGSGSDVIYGFNAAIDHVQLDGSTKFTSWSSIQSALTQSGADAVLDMGNGQTLTFRNTTVGALTSADFQYPIPTSTFTETFDDEFNTFVSSPSGDYGWMTTWPYGGISNRAPLGNDQAYYGDSTTKVNPFTDVNGVLDITATAVPAGSNSDNLLYNTGVITTYKSLSQLYGYFEIRVELPTGQGLWPAFYMQSDNNAAELDIYEIPGSSSTNLYATATDHTTGASTSQLIIIPNSSTAFHTYGVDWEPTTVTFYMDGNVIATAATPASMHQPMYMIAALGVGSPGSWAGAPTSNSIFPATEQVDYVRAYATAATQYVGGTAAIPVPIIVTPATDTVASANGASVKPFTGVVITDINASQTETATVAINAANGVLSDPNAATDGSKIANGVLTVSGSAAAVATVLDGLVFTPNANQAAPSVTTTVTATIKDTAGKTAAVASTITATVPVPIMVTPMTSAVASASGAPVTPFTGVVITDANAAQTETVTVALSAANGVLSDPNAATDGSTVANGVLTVSGSSAAVATALDGLVFTPNTNQTAPSVTTTVTATIQDTAGETDFTTSTITATVPVPITVTPAMSAVASASGAPVTPFTGVVITDANAAQTETATVALSAANGVLSDPNAAMDGSTIVNGVLTVSGSSAAVATALDGLVFTPNTNQTAPSVTTTVTATIQDTAGETDSTTSTITATVPVPITVTPAMSAVASASDAAVTPFTGVVITDANAAQTETATVALSAANGVLSDPNAAMDGSTIANGVLTVSGSSAAVATALDGLVFTPNTNQTAPSVTTTVTATIQDTAGETDSTTSTITATPPATTGPAPTPDTLALQVSEDPAGGTDAQFTVSVNGNQVGGVYTASALNSSGYDSTILLTGDWDSGANSVAVSYVNDAGNRNLYVNSIAYDGVTYAGTTAALLTDSTKAFTVGGATPIAVAPVDTITLSLSEEALNGINALFQLYIDGVAVTTPQSVTALYANKATQSFTYTGDLGTGTHTIGVGFVNDGYGGSLSLDRNLYINGITLDGTTVFSGVKEQGIIGVSTWTASEPTPPPPTPDILALQMSEDPAARADAQFTVSVNGTQVGGVYTASALHSSGDANTILLTGSWGSGVNDVAISFINDDGNRNLYVNSIAYDGTTYAGTTAALLTNSTDTFTVGGATPTASAPADSLTLSLSEDAYNGNALFQLYIDGKVVSTPQMVSALQANDATQSFSFTGDFGAGTHTIGVGFVNDGYGGSPSLDRNLYIDGVTLNGAAVFSGVKEQNIVGVSTWTVTTTH